MSIRVKLLTGSVLPTVVVVAVVMLTAMLGLVALWEQEALRFARSVRLMQARADVEAAFTLYRLHPGDAALTDPGGYLLYDSLPRSRVTVAVRPWGLYELVRVATADSILCVCRLMGAEPIRETLYVADDRTAVTLAGRTELRGQLSLPQNGLAYGRVGADLFRGREIDPKSVRRSAPTLPAPDSMAGASVAAIFAGAVRAPYAQMPDSTYRSFHDSAAVFRLGDAELAGVTLRGNCVLYGDELRIDSACRLDHPLIVARKITVGHGTRMAAQLFARDTVVVEAWAVMEYPSGIYAGRCVRLEEHAEVNGYVIVRQTEAPPKIAAACQQARTARLRGLLWSDGAAQIQGIVSGSAMMKQPVYFSPQGYYKNMIYGLTVLENRATAHPLWLRAERRKEVVCVD